MSFGENLCFRLGCDEIDAYSYNDFIKMLLFFHHFRLVVCIKYVNMSKAVMAY